MSQQSDIFTADDLQLGYAELCNALYERELQALANQCTTNPDLLRRRLNGLSYLIRRAARVLLQPQGPLLVDTHNASWQNKQAGHCPGLNVSEEHILNWYQTKARMGIVVPVYVQEPGFQQIELDSIDRIDTEQKKFHLNKNGWFSLPQANYNPLSPGKRLLKPAKSVLVSACCGHRWDHKHKILPRPLTLREIMLASHIQWNR